MDEFPADVQGSGDVISHLSESFPVILFLIPTPHYIKTAITITKVRMGKSICRPFRILLIWKSLVQLEVEKQEDVPEHLN